MTTSGRLPNVLRNVKWGVSGGLGIASFYCAWVLVIYLVGGNEPFRQQGVSLQGVVATYLAVGVSAGAVIGLLKPLADHWFGAFVVGLVASIPIAAGLMICVKGWPTTWSERDRHLFPVFTVLVSGVVGFLLNQRAEERRTNSDPRR